MENKNLVPQENNAIQEFKVGGVVTPPGKDKSYITRVLFSLQQRFLEVNPGMDLDFVNLADVMRLTGLGQFVDKDDESINFGTFVDVVIGMGDTRFVLWGPQNTPYEGELIVAHKSRDEAVSLLRDWLEANPEAQEYVTEDLIKINHVAYMVPVEKLGPDVEIPPVYVQFFPQTDVYEYGRYAKNITFGKYKHLGIPAWTSVSSVITRISSTEKRKNDKKWVGRKFEPVGLFKPEEFGLK